MSDNIQVCCSFRSWDDKQAAENAVARRRRRARIYAGRRRQQGEEGGGWQASLDEDALQLVEHLVGNDAEGIHQNCLYEWKLYESRWHILKHLNLKSINLSRT